MDPKYSRFFSDFFSEVFGHRFFFQSEVFANTSRSDHRSLNPNENKKKTSYRRRRRKQLVRLGLCRRRRQKHVHLCNGNHAGWEGDQKNPKIEPRGFWMPPRVKQAQNGRLNHGLFAQPQLLSNMRNPYLDPLLPYTVEMGETWIHVFLPL